jgi:rhamnulokinase
MAAKAVHFLAMDYGAESGRGELVTLRKGRLALEEIHRFPNRPVRLAGTLYWDFPYLFAECLAAIRQCAQRGVKLAGIGVDTWGVDFGLLDTSGELLSNPVHYRDSRTEKIHDYTNRIMSTDDIFQATANEPWAISTLFQLAAMRRGKSPLLEMAGGLLHMNDLFSYFLTGVRAHDVSNIGTGNLVGPDRRFSAKVIKAFHLPRKLFGQLIEPGTVVGEILPAIRKETGIGPVPIIAAGGHDTAAAVAAVPAEGDDWAFVSCGTWSILGTLLDKPNTKLDTLRRGFTNEPTVGGWYMCRNIQGLWMVQQLRAKWDTSSDPWDYNRIAAAAAQATSGAVFSVGDSSLMAPQDMEEALRKLIQSTHQAAPKDRGGLVRSVLESLALEYSLGLATMTELTGKKFKAVYLVGGGIKNRLLCQLTADACGMPVYAGVDQCTAVGNALIQALAVSAVKSVEQIRQVARESFGLHTYQPTGKAEWEAKRKLYRQLRSA